MKNKNKVVTKKVATKPKEKIVNKVKPNIKSSEKANIKKQAPSKTKTSLVLILSLVFTMIISAGIGYFIWDSSKKFDITFAVNNGITYEGYSSLEVSKRKDFCFSIVLEQGIVAYPQLHSVTANGTALTPVNGVYTVKNVKQDTMIIAEGFGTSGLQFNQTTLTTGINVSKVVVPYGVTSINQSAFENMSSINEIVFPESLTQIGITAFHNCSNLQTIVATQNLKEIGINAFLNTKWLADKADGLVCLGSVIYSYKGNFATETSLTLPEGIHSITAHAFWGKTNLISIIMPNSLELIGSYSFANCSDLLLIQLSPNIKSFGNSAFIETAWFEQQPNGLVYLDNWLYTFKGFSPVTSISIREETVGIAGNCFFSLGYQPTPMTIDFPNSLKYIGNSSFMFLNIQNIELPSSLLMIEEYAFSNSRLTSITIPNNVIKVGKNAFNSCQFLVSVIIESGIVEIDEFLFAGCTALRDITLYNSIKTIQTSAFFGCQSLNNFKMYTTTPPAIIGENFLVYSPTTLKISVLETYLTTYKSSAGWSAFADKIIAIVETE